MNLEILRNLVSFDTAYDKQNKEIITYLKNYLEDLNFSTKVLTKEGKSCLIATIGENPYLGFMCHTDTVPISNNWNKSPLELTEDGNYLYGLGVCDMKGGTAALLEALTKVDLKNLKQGLSLYFTYDEELGFAGIKQLVDQELVFPKKIVLPEPTDNRPVLGNKGCLEYEVTFQGKAAHSSDPSQGLNALCLAIDFIKEIDVFATSLKKEKNLLYEIPYATYNLATINGGNAINLIPDQAVITFSFRTVFKEQNSLIEETVSSIASKYPCTVKVLNSVGTAQNDDFAFINYVETITAKTKTAFNYTTEASFLPGVDTLILGPGPITAHEADESITKESYQKTVNNYIDIIKYCLY